MTGSDRRGAAVAAVILAFAAVAYLFRGLLLPVLLAALVAYLLNPFITWAQGLAIRRDVAVGTLYFVLGAGLAAGIGLLGPRLRTEGLALANSLPTMDRKIDAIAEMAHREAVAALPGLQGVLPRWEGGRPITTRLFRGESGPLGLLVHLGAGLLLVVLVPFFAFFFLRDSRGLIKLVMDRLPPRHIETSVAVWSEVDRIIGHYLRGVALDGIAVGALAAFGLWLADIPYPLVLGAVTGFANMVPLLGPLLGAASAVLVCLTQGLGFPGVGRALLVFLFLKVVDDLVIQPQTIGRSVHLHPLLVVASVIAGDQAFGVIGMFMAVPAVTAAQELVRLLVQHQQVLRGVPEKARLAPESVPAYLC